jgi:hypothetical protein
LERTISVRELNEWIAHFDLQRNPPKDEPFWSEDPKVMADKMREILAPRPKTSAGRRK